MNVLEMEEAQSLVGSENGGRKFSGSSNRNAAGGALARTIVQRNFLANVLVAAFFVMMLLLYISSKNSEGSDPLYPYPHGVEVKDHPDHHVIFDNDTTPSAGTGLDIHGDGGATTAASGDANANDNADHIDGGEDGSNSKIDLSKDVDTDKGKGVDTNERDGDRGTDPEISEQTDNKSNSGGKDDEDSAFSDSGADGDEANPINIYSKFATLQPLTNLPFAEGKKSEELVEKWGKWNFWDGDEDLRPKEDYLSKYPHKDIPGDELPEDAWQADAVFVNHYLNDADHLISRAMEAIYSEYGHPKDELTPDEIIERDNTVFHWFKHDFAQKGQHPSFEKRAKREEGGYMSERTHEGMIRRLLHAMMTSDTFTVVVAGHSVAAGAGNKFHQNYSMQFHKIMSPIFARLGVKLVTRNVANGGLGCFQSSMGAQSIYGDDVDVLVWDSGMTEGQGREIEFFARQNVLGGKRAPALWAMSMHIDHLKFLYELGGMDVVEWGEATKGIPVTESQEQVETLPWATRYLQCANGAESICNDAPRFCCTCWVDREDGIFPPTPQKENSSNNGDFHPGWRTHQLRGRNLAFGMLWLLQEAVDIWKTSVSGGPPLDDSLWHVKDHYEKIREHFKNIKKKDSHCGWDGDLPDRICDIPLKAATQYTPRANFATTGITAIAKAAPDGTVVRNTVKNLFDGPEPPNPCQQIPEGEVDVYAIVSGRRRTRRNLRHSRGMDTNLYVSVESSAQSGQMHEWANRTLEKKDTGIVPGKGWEVMTEPSGICDGTYDSICNRGPENDCMLQAYQSGRGSVVGTEYSGWLVLNLADLKEGIIILKLECWHDVGSHATTANWTSVNNERNLKKWNSKPQPETMIFDYAIDGEITSLARDEFFQELKTVGRTITTLTILDDPKFTKEAKDVEVAIRMRECGQQCTFGLSHVYWA